MVARDPDDRPDLTALAPLAFKGLRRLRGARPPHVATHLEMSLRAYEHFENGKGRLNIDRIHAFAALLNVDPFAILSAFEIGSPSFALRCADNKLMMIFMMALQDFDATAQDDIAYLDPFTLMEAFTKLFAELTTRAKDQARLAAQWNGGKDADAPESKPDPDTDPPPREDPEPEPE